jgi:Lar family restriction alleviation protein
MGSSCFIRCVACGAHGSDGFSEQGAWFFWDKAGDVEFESQEKRPCPFCGEPDPEIGKDDDRDMFMFCPGCGAEGPSADDTEDARRKWNLREGGRGGRDKGSIFDSPQLDLREKGKQPMKKQASRISTDKLGREVELWTVEDLQYDLKTGLVPGMPVTVYRPWNWFKPFDSWLAARIRAYSSEIVGHAASEHHAMLYTGLGRAASQDWEYKVKGLSDYVGDTLTFYMPLWADEPRVIGRLCREAWKYEGREYGYLDIAGQVMRALTGRRAWVQAIGDSDNWICSEAVCQVIRKTADPDYGGGPYCDHTPQGLADWMIAQGWGVRRIKVMA